jgi:hypothetical protein
MNPQTSLPGDAPRHDTHVPAYVYHPNLRFRRHQAQPICLHPPSPILSHLPTGHAHTCLVTHHDLACALRILLSQHCQPCATPTNILTATPHPTKSPYCLHSAQLHTADPLRSGLSQQPSIEFSIISRSMESLVHLLSYVATGATCPIHNNNPPTPPALPANSVTSTKQKRMDKDDVLLDEAQNVPNLGPTSSTTASTLTPGLTLHRLSVHPGSRTNTGAPLRRAAQSMHTCQLNSKKRVSKPRKCSIHTSLET